MMEFLENELNEESINESYFRNTINREILQDIISDHELCFVQKEELQKVIEKEKPKKVVVATINIDYGRVECPTCHSLVPKGIGRIRHCVWCGQKFEWL